MSNPAGQMIELRNLGFSYGRLKVFEHLNATVGRGERLVLLGRSGTGKSTLLRLVGGLLRPTAGALLRHDVEGGQRARAGFVFQDHALLPWLTGMENIRLALRLSDQPLSRADQKTRIEEAADRLSIRPVLDYYPHQLSGGMRQRVALARALATDPTLLCLDEPFSALDPVLRREAREVVEMAIEASGAATIIVTHDIGDALALADRIWLLRSEAAGPSLLEIRRGDPCWSMEGLLMGYR